jgi:hypothetical protein
MLIAQCNQAVFVLLFRCGLRKRRMVKCCWKAREDISTIIVHPDMLLDHTPHRVKSMLKRFQQYPDQNGYPVEEGMDRRRFTAPY